MSIYYISDLHISHHAKYVEDIPETMEKIIGDEIITSDKQEHTLIVSGDTAEINGYILIALLHAKTFFKDVIYVLGNHDYYLLGDDVQRYKTSLDKVKQLTELLNRADIIVLNNDTIELEGKTISGGTMWYPLPKEKLPSFEQNSNDSYYIKGLDIHEQHLKDIDWYNSVIENTDIMITHVPLIETESHQYFGNTDFYLTKVDKFAPIHIFGHTHEIRKYKRDDSVHLTNALGFRNMKNTSKGYLRKLVEVK